MNKTGLRWVLGLALVVAIALALAWRDRFDAAALQAWVEGAGASGPVLFMGLYALATVLFQPGAVLTLAGGALFGPLWGTLWNLTGATLGAALAFLIARHLGADWVARRAGPRLQRLNEGVASEGWRFVAFVRLVRNITIALSLLAAVVLLPRLVRKLRARPMLEVLDLKRQLDAHEDVLLLDVRTAAEFTGDLGHIAQARNVPLEELPERLAEFESRKQRPVRLICRTDRRSTQAARLLAEAGFSDPQVIRGGMTAWRANGWAVAGA